MHARALPTEMPKRIEMPRRGKERKRRHEANEANEANEKTKTKQNKKKNKRVPPTTTAGELTSSHNTVGTLLPPPPSIYFLFFPFFIRAIEKEHSHHVHDNDYTTLGRLIEAGIDDGRSKGRLRKFVNDSRW